MILPKEMRFMVRVILATVLALLALPGVGSAQEAVPSVTSSAPTAQTAAIVGTWQLHTSGPAVLLVHTYFADGNMTAIHDEHATRNPQLGVWAQVGDRQFLMRNVSYRFDASGQVAAIVEVRGVYTVAPDGNTMSGHGIRFDLDPSGAELGPVVPWDSQATRLVPISLEEGTRR